MIGTKIKSTTSLQRIEHEVRRLRSLVISLAGQDSEGVYRPEFVEKILQASTEKPSQEFLNAKDFLRQIS